MATNQLSSKVFFSTLLIGFLSTAVTANPESESIAVLSQLEEITGKVAAAEKADQTVLEGKDGWLYFVPELRALSVGPFWGDYAAAVSRARKPEYADPINAIVDFHRQLKDSGIRLLLIPIPAKLVIYPEPLLSNLPIANDEPPLRLDIHHRRFYELLAERGIDLIDLCPLFLTHRDVGQGPLYCKTDSHWSGRGVSLAAEAIADRLQKSGWLKDLARMEFASEKYQITITGDLAMMMNEAQPKTENLQITVCGQRQENQLIVSQPSRSSPVLLIGDSHTLVFHDPSLFASGAGLPDHLARRLGFAIDLIGVRGSGATSTRIELLRRDDNLAGKKVVIWCFSFREFTESDTGWRKVPVIRPVEKLE